MAGAALDHGRRPDIRHEREFGGVEAGITAVPHQLYSVPNLRFVEESRKFYGDFFQTKILDLPHPTLYRGLNNLCSSPRSGRQ